MRTRQRAMVLVVAPLVLLLGGAVAAHGSAAVDVTVRAKAFEPASVQIAPGQSVRWTVADLGAHELRAADGSWSSGQLVKGMSFTRTFEQPGTYRYYDALNGRCGDGGCTGMVGQVVVEAPASPAPVEVEDVEPDPEPSPASGSPKAESAGGSAPDRSAASHQGATAAPPPPPAPAPDPEPRRDPRPGATRPLYLETRELPVEAGDATLVALQPLVAPPRSPAPERAPEAWEPRMTIGPLPPTPEPETVSLTLWATASAILSLTAGVLGRERLRAPFVL